MNPDRKKEQPTNPARPTPPRPHRSGAEDAEPSAAQAGLPVIFFVILALLLFFGMVYLDNHAGGFNPNVYGGFSSTNEVAKYQPYDPVGDKLNRGLAVYNMPTCVSCHQANGLGTPPTFPPLAGAEWVLEPDPARIIRIVLNGLRGPMQVKGQPYNGEMVPWKANLNDQQVADVLTYVRKSWGNNAPEVMPEQVAKVRQETADRSIPWTADELLQIPVGAQ